jgi:predicted outer membrane repeat protein
VAVAGACLLLGGLSALGASAAGGAAPPVTLYAGASASGSANCSSAANACTLSTALADTAAGDVVALVTAGVEGTPSTYYSGGFSIATPGTSASFPVVIEPAPGVTNPILDGGGTQGVLDVTNNMYLVIDGVTIQHGSASFGGAVENDAGGTLTADDSTFTGNTASLYGGAIDSSLDTVHSGTLTVNGSTFTDNTAVDGGAIDIDNSDNLANDTSSVNDSTFSNNGASSDGGAIDSADHGGGGTLTVTASTFTSNSAGQDGPTVDNGDHTGAGAVVAAADIFAGRCQNLGGWIDVGDNVGSDTTCQNGGTGDAVSANLASELAPLANNGGPTRTVALLAGNPAAGLIPNGSGVLCPVADQTGVASPPGAPCNAGALQIHPSVKSVKITGTQAVPKVTIKGSGFGIVGNLGLPTASCGGSGAGSDYPNTIQATDVTRNWNAGNSEFCSHIGLFVTSYSGTKIIFHFGSTLGSFGGMHRGDKVEVTLFGTTTTITAPV